MVSRVNLSLRALLLPPLRPIWRRVWIRIETGIRAAEIRLNAGIQAQQARLALQEARLAALDGAWRQHVPAFLNAVASVDAFAHQLVQLRDQTIARLDGGDASIAALRERIGEGNAQLTARLDNDDASIAALWERIEFVRREILFEIAHRATHTATDEAVKSAARVLDAGKVAAAQAARAFRLNLGCGHIALPDYVNVDMREVPGVDVLAEVGDLPFEPASVDEIASAHLLEHFPQERLSRQLLPHWFALLRPGGTFRAVTPDAAAMLAGAGAGTYCFEDFREAVFGAQDYGGDYHYNLFTPDSLRGLLEEAGFRDVQVPVSGRRNGKCFEFEIIARRP
jgi:predicted SAM-dependent methyltransferase